MRKLLTAAALALLFPLTASAQLSVGAKLGLSIPWGEEIDGADMQDGLDFIVPIEVNGMFEVAPKMAVGAYLSYGFAKLDADVSDACDLGDVDCSAHQWRLGVMGQLKLDEVKGQMSFTPYVGANLGMEWGVYKRSATDYDVKAWDRGWELGLEAGADMPVNPGLTMGAFVNLSFARYGTVGVDSDIGGATVDDSTSIPSSAKATHGFFQIGVRGNFDIAMK
jgi:hypothetical protein